MTPLAKNTYREILRSPGRFLAILAIIVLGSGFFVGLRVSEKAMTATANTYLAETSFHDFSVATTLGLSQEDVEALAADPDVLDAEGSFERDALVDLGDGTDRVYAFYSLPRRIDTPDVLEGRLPENAGECLADSWSGLSVGDKVVLAEDNDQETLELFTVRELTVAGVCTSPLYLNFERGSTSLGSGAVASFCYVLPEVFDADYYTSVYVRCPDMPEGYSQEYDRRSEALEDRLTDLAEERGQARYASVVSDAQAELDDARAEYDDALNTYTAERADTEAELSDAWAELEDARVQLEDAAKEIGDGKRELEDGRAELTESWAALLDAKRELDGAKAELDDAKRQLDEGWEEYDKGVSQLEEERFKGQNELDSAKAQLEDSLAQLEDGEAEYAESLALYEDGERQYSEGMASYRSGVSTLNGYEAQLNSGLEDLDAGKKTLKDQLGILIQLAPFPGIPYSTADEFYDALMAQDAEALELLQKGLTLIGDSRTAEGIVNQIKTAEQSLAYLDSQIASGRAELSASRAILRDSRAQLDEAKDQLDQGREELDEGWSAYQAGLQEYEDGLETFNISMEEAERTLSASNDQLLDAQAKYDEGLADYNDGLAQYEDGLSKYYDGAGEIKRAEAELADAEQQYADGLAEYEDGLSEYEDARQEADRAFADAEAELADAKEELDSAQQEILDIPRPESYLLGRWGNVGYECFKSDASIVRSISAVFPLFFFLVAALICITTVSRMVEEQRSQLGVLMAMGYSRLAVMSKFLIYAGLATTLGGATGILLGSRVIPLVVWQAYRIMYSFSDTIEFTFDLPLSAGTFLAYLAAMLGVTYFSCRRQLGDVPANVIRPRAPKAGKRVLLERVPLIWNRLSFLWKVTVRNIFRYKARVLMMILGIGGCTALMMTGMGINDSIRNVVDYQFSEISLYDFTVTFASELDAEEQAQFMESVSHLADDALFLHQSSFTASANRTEKDVYLNAVDSRQLDLIGEFVDFHRGGAPLPFPGEGEALINSGLASALSLRTGDVIELRDGDGGTMTLTVSGVYDNYIYNNIYITSDTYAAYAGGSPEINYALVLKNDSAATGEALAEILGMENVLTASASQEMRDRIGSMMESLIYIVLLTIVCAAALAFVVIYNLTNINIQERLRELATVKVLGFYDLESALYVLRENLLLTVIGAAVGVPMGLALNAYVMAQVKIDLIHFTPRVLPMSYVYSIALTFLFSLLVDGIMFLRLKRINPAEALKAAE